MPAQFTRREAIVTIGATGTALTAGCLGDSDDGDIELTVMTAAEETTGFQMAAAAAAVINDQEDDLTIDNLPADGAAQGMFEMDAGNTDIAYTHTAMANDMVLGEGAYIDTEYESELGGMFHMYSVQSGLTAPEDSGIETVYDLEGQRVAPNPAGSAIRPPLVRMIEHAISEDDYETVALGFNEEPQALAEGRVDVISDLRINGGQATPGYVEEQYSIHDLWLVHWPDDVVEAIEADPLVQGTYYSGEDMAGPLMGDRTEELWLDTLYNFYTTMDADQEAIYRYMSAIWEHRDAIAESHGLTANWNDEGYFTTGVDIEVPLHPGAEQFYDEEGIDI